MRIRVLLHVIGVWVGAAGLVSCGARSEIVDDVNETPHDDAAPGKDTRDARGEDVCPGLGCDGGLVCSDGPCCTGGLATCAGVCVDVMVDPSNCGGCRVVCPAEATCLDGGCVCPPGTHE